MSGPACLPKLSLPAASETTIASCMRSQVEAMVDPQKGAAWSQPWLKL